MALEEKDSTLSRLQETSNIASFVINLVVNCEENDKILLEKPSPDQEWRCPEVRVQNGEGFVDAVSRWLSENVFLRKVCVCEGMLSVSFLIDEAIPKLFCLDKAS